MVQNVVSAWGRLDILANNAGILADARLVNMSPEQWKRVIDVNHKGISRSARRPGPK